MQYSSTVMRTLIRFFVEADERCWGDIRLQVDNTLYSELFVCFSSFYFPGFIFFVLL